MPASKPVPASESVPANLGRSRRGFLRTVATALGTAVLGGCDRLSRTEWFPKVLGTGETLNNATQHALTPRSSLAREYPASAASAVFRGNGSTNPQQPEYAALRDSGFSDYRLKIGGLVETPLSLSLADLRALPSRTQTTRHDCVEGWSDIGTWTGPPLAAVLDRAGVKPSARFVVFYCADQLSADGPKYYESIDLEDARHPQTILAYNLNGAPLPIANGAPLRVRVERQLGYKMAKYIMAIELVESFAHIQKGRGGYWEDRGYEWYAGI